MRMSIARSGAARAAVLALLTAVAWFGVGSPAFSQSLGFLYNGGTFTTIVPPGSTYSTANDINNAGQIVGDFAPSFGQRTAGFLYDTGSYTTIKPPGSIQSFASGINNTGQIAGN